MTKDIHLTDTNRTNSKTLAAGAFGLAGIVTIATSLAGAQAGYQSLLFVWSHIGALVACGLVAVAGTAVLYAEGSRRLGLAGLLGTGFAWVATGAAALWVTIAWQATVFFRTGSTSLDVFTALFSPLGSAYFVAISLVLGLGLAGLGIGFWATDLVHRPVAGLVGAVGAVGALWMLYVFGTAMAAPFQATPTIPLIILQWAAVTVLGGSLFLTNRSSTPETETDTAVSAD